MRRGLVALSGIVLGLAAVWGGEGAASRPASAPATSPTSALAQFPDKLRELPQPEYAAAQQASGAADRMRGDFEAKYGWHPSNPFKPTSELAQKEREEVIAAFNNVIYTYPNTEHAAYSGLGLAGFYQYIGQADKAIETAKQVATVFQKTQYGPQAALNLGYMYLQTVHDPEESIKWFEKVPAPKNNPVGIKGADEGAKYYLSAQQGIARAKAELDKIAATRPAPSTRSGQATKPATSTTSGPATQAATATQPAEWKKSPSGLESRLEFEVWNKGEALCFRILVRNATDKGIKVGGFQYNGMATYDGVPYAFYPQPILEPAFAEKNEPVIKAGWTGEFGRWYYPLKDSFKSGISLQRSAEGKWMHLDLQPGRHTVAYEMGQIQTTAIEFEFPPTIATQPATDSATKPASMPNTQPAAKHTIAMYLITTRDVAFDKLALTDFSLGVEPLITERDIASYDWDSHTIFLKDQAAADRVLTAKGIKASVNDSFMLIVDGQRIYRGAMRSDTSSNVPNVPVIHYGYGLVDYQPKGAIRIYEPPITGSPDTRGDARLKKALEALALLAKDGEGKSAASRPAASAASGPATQAAADAAEIARLIRELASADEVRRSAAERKLVQIGQPAIVTLDAAAAGKDAELAKQAKAVAETIEQQAIASMMRKCGDQLGGLISPDELARRRVVVETLYKGLLHSTSSAGSLKLLTAAAAAEEPCEVRHAMMVLAQELDAQVREGFLIALLKSDPDCFVRNAAAGMLGRTGSESAVDALIEAARSDRSTSGRMGCIGMTGTARREAMFALALLAKRQPKAAPKITQALRDLKVEYDPKDNESLYDVRLQALYQITGDAKLLEPFLKRLKSTDAKERLSGVVAFRFFNISKAPPELLERLKDEDGDVQSCAAMVLGEIGDPAAVEGLIAIAGDAKAYLNARTNAVVSLGRIGDRSAVPTLERLTEVAEGNVGYCAKRSLELICAAATNPATAPAK